MLLPSLRGPWRGRGLARALLVRSLALLKDHGMQEAALNVDTANAHGALGLYESVGFQVVQRNTTYSKPWA